MIRRHLGHGPLVASAALLFCCGTILAEEGPFLPGLDAIPKSPPYVPYPAEDNAPAKSRRTLRPLGGSMDRQRSAKGDAASRPASQDDTTRGAISAKSRSGGHTRTVSRKTGRPVPARERFDEGRLRSCSIARPVSSCRSKRQLESTGRASTRAELRTILARSIAAPLASAARPWPTPGRLVANRPIPARVPLLSERKPGEPDKTPRPPRTSRAPRTSSALPQKSPSRTVPLGRQSSKTPPNSSRTGQPASSRIAR